MIPFNVFRRGSKDPTATLYYSGLLDNVDYWGRTDRQTIIKEIKQYTKCYALDWGLTTFILYAVGMLIGAFINGMLGIVEEPDYCTMFCTVILCALLPSYSINHILDSYTKALEVSSGGGGNV